MAQLAGIWSKRKPKVSGTTAVTAETAMIRFVLAQNRVRRCCAGELEEMFTTKIARTESAAMNE
jgi:hypothetical protein